MKVFPRYEACPQMLLLTSVNMYCLIFFSNCFSSPIASNLTNTTSIFETILPTVGSFCQLCKMTINSSYETWTLSRGLATELQLNRANSSDTEAPFFGFESM